MAREHDIGTLPKWARKRLKALQQRIDDLGRLEMLVLDEAKLLNSLEFAIKHEIGFATPVGEMIIAVHRGQKIRSAIREHLLKPAEAA